MMAKTGKTPSFLPNEIEENIISRIPVKTVLRFMSVCRSWYSLFLDPNFINIHVENASNNLHLLQRLRKCNDIVVSSSSSCEVRSRFFSDGVDDYKRTIVGSCNGIVCLYGLRHYLNKNDYYICLWNPALRFIKFIANGVGYPCWHYPNSMLVGFGFHSNDYKVLILQNITRVGIYSLSLDSWRTVNVAPHDGLGYPLYPKIHKDKCVGVFVNGAHHWALESRKAETRHSPAILSFDMGEEVFKEITVPSEYMKRRQGLSSFDLFNCNESLAILAYYYGSTDRLPCIWVMKEYGSPESWTKFCKIDIKQVLGRAYLRYIHGGEHSVVYDIDKSEANYPSISITNVEALKDAVEVTTYRESLVLLNSTTVLISSGPK